MNSSPISDRRGLVADRRGLAVLAIALAGTLVLAGCGGGDSNSDSSYSSSGNDSSTAKTTYGYGGESPSKTPNPSGGAATVATASVGDLGKVLVDSNGMTLYLFEKDENGKSACYGACAQAWPPLTTEEDPVAKSGASQGKLKTTSRKDGSTQVTYAGWPLYFYAGDTEPGQASGNDIDGFGAQWYALTPSGEKPEDS